MKQLIHQCLLGNLLLQLDTRILLQILAVIGGGIASLLFAAPRIPFVESFARPQKFETGWESLITNGSLSYTDPGFREVTGFLLREYPEFRKHVANDLSIDQAIVPYQQDGSDWLIEEIRIAMNPGELRPHILLCYEKSTDGPGTVETRRGDQIPVTADSGEEWRWFGDIMIIEYKVQNYITSEIQKWSIFGALFLALSIALQTASIILS
ncbi:hypothetical protein [Halogeometricum luteum]|uniref:Uncharacterized protein n=1 Tax=Halogeometricum luteum TaxID=2950537 RepID=A0ABU2G4R7_9EURY|nr:hypothetical protein [Halogeometricum sp. S3BR5-2]MDS0295784.1 hypothetical protein [Halogeometricum sp. S3BR5-2]